LDLRRLASFALTGVGLVNNVMSTESNQRQIEKG
jgi:hypothetical protein